MDKLASCALWRGLVASKKLRIGYQQKGNIINIQSYLSILEATYQRKIKLVLVRDVKKNFTTISSSKIRRLIENGHVKKAQKLLSYFYCLQGDVLPGKQLGRSIGFPTLNVAYPNEKALIKEGVYITLCQLNAAKTLSDSHPLPHWSMTFVGVPLEKDKKEKDKNNQTKKFYNRNSSIKF